MQSAVSLKRTVLVAILGGFIIAAGITWVFHMILNASLVYSMLYAAACAVFVTLASLTRSWRKPQPYNGHTYL